MIRNTIAALVLYISGANPILKLNYSNELVFVVYRMLLIVSVITGLAIIRLQGFVHWNNHLFFAGRPVKKKKKKKIVIK